MLDLAFMGKVLPLYYEGALLTLRVGTIGILLALAVGMVTAVARYWRIPILNTAAVIYTEFSRNTPLLVQLFFLYFGLPKVGIRISGEWCAIIGLAFLGGSYMAEALRAGLESVSTVQTESARVLGLTPFQTMMLVVLPQAFAVSVPPLVANIIFLIKEISVVSAIALPDLMYVTKDLFQVCAVRNRKFHIILGALCSVEHVHRRKVDALAANFGNMRCVCRRLPPKSLAQLVSTKRLPGIWA